MRQITFRVINKDYDEAQQKIVTYGEIFLRSFLTEQSLEEIQEQIGSILKERFESTANFSNDAGILTIITSGQSLPNPLMDYFNSFEPIFDSEELPDSLQNVDFSSFVQITLDSDNMDEKTVQKIQLYLHENAISSKVFNAKHIIERGASGHLVGYLLAVGATLTAEVIKGLYKLLKGKNVDNVSSLEISSSVKDFLIKEYDLRPSSFFLASYREDPESKQYLLTYKSKTKTYYVICDAKFKISNVEVE